MPISHDLCRSFLNYVTVRFHGYGDGCVIFSAGHRACRERYCFVSSETKRYYFGFDVNYLHSGGYYAMRRALAQCQHVVLLANCGQTNVVKTCSSNIGEIVVSKPKNN